MLVGVGGPRSATFKGVDESTKFCVIFDDNGGVVDPLSTFVLSHDSLLTSVPLDYKFESPEIDKNNNN